jgi:hypothetical protein
MDRPFTDDQLRRLEELKGKTFATAEEAKAATF